jgi:hypothetical protein
MKNKNCVIHRRQDLCEVCGEPYHRGIDSRHCGRVACSRELAVRDPEWARQTARFAGKA